MTVVGFLMEQALNRVPGGTGRYSRDLARALVAGAGQGDRLVPWTAWHRDLAAARVPGAPPPRRLPLPRRVLSAAWARGVGPAPRAAELVHAPTLLAPPPRGRPLVVTIHDAVPWTHPETLTPRGVAWHRAMAQRVARTADALIVPSDAVAADLGPRLRPRGEIVVIPEGVSPDLRVPPDADLRAARLHLPAEFVLSVSTLEPRKGLDTLLAAYAGPSAPTVPLLVVGPPGWGGVDLAAEAARLGVPRDSLRVLGRLSDEDLSVVMARARVLAMPSRSEGFGLPVLEAMHFGVPVVTSDAPALVELGGDATLRVPVGDSVALGESLASVLTDTALARRMSSLGEARAARFTWDAAGARTWDLYRRLT